MLDGDVWRTNAAAANAGAALLAAAAPDRLVYPVEANEVFLRMSPAEAAKLRALGFDFYDWAPGEVRQVVRSEEHTSELQSLMRISYAVFCLKKQKKTNGTHNIS